MRKIVDSVVTKGLMPDEIYELEKAYPGEVKSFPEIVSIEGTSDTFSLKSELLSSMNIIPSRDEEYSIELMKDSVSISVTVTNSVVVKFLKALVLLQRTYSQVVSRIIGDYFVKCVMLLRGSKGNYNAIIDLAYDTKDTSMLAITIYDELNSAYVEALKKEGYIEV